MSLDLGRFISKVYIKYLELVYKTSKIEIKLNNGDIVKNSIIGFWHGDSYVMNLLMKELSKEEIDVAVVVTADKRGDYIEETLNYYNMRALRMPDGIKMKYFLRELNDESKKENSTLVISLDGPLGPLHEPKKIGFKLANTSEKNFLATKIEIKRKITLTRRWDNYIIPLPFSEIKFSIVDFGKVSKENLINFNIYKEKLKKELLDDYIEIMNDKEFVAGNI